MATSAITMAELESTLEKNEIILIDFWAEWCGPCKMFGPIFEKASEKYPDIKFLKCDTEAAPDLAQAFGVTSIPMVAIFREKVLVYKQAGLLQETQLDDLIKQIQGLDMDEVRKQIAESGQQ